MLIPLEKPIWSNCILYYSKKLTIKEIIKTIDLASLQICIILNNKKQLLGTITDGDIRRALLKGNDINSNIDSVINLYPKFTYENNQIKKNSNIFNSYQLSHLPILNKNKTINTLMVREDLVIHLEKKNYFFIMAGGQGKRLLPLTKKLPKPLVKIDNKPIIEHIIENAKKHGFKNFIISVNYLAPQFKKFFNNKKIKQLNINLEFIEESKPMGTGGSIGLIKKKISKPIVISNGDIISNINYSSLLNFHSQKKSDATMVVNSFVLEHPYGVVKTRGAKISNIIEKPKNKDNINAGVYVLSPKIINNLNFDEQINMTNIFINLINLKKSVFAFPLHESWRDIGNIRDLYKAKNKN